MLKSALISSMLSAKWQWYLCQREPCKNSHWNWKDLQTWIV